jgi:hypothetical protein
MAKEDDPAVRLVAQCYNYMKKYNHKTQVIVSGIRKKEDALAVAGIDYLIIPSRIIYQLQCSPTYEGYNDDIHGGSAAAGTENTFRRLSIKTAEAATFDPADAGPVAEAAFHDGLQRSIIGEALLKECLVLRQGHLDELQPLMNGVALGTE